MWRAEMLKWATAAALVVQSHWRGHRVRRRYRGFKLERQRQVEREWRRRQLAATEALHERREAEAMAGMLAELEALKGGGGEDHRRRAQAAEAVAAMVVKKDDEISREKVPKPNLWRVACV
jgi:hypothetical protein